jgi:hypothetical protein
MEAGRWFSKALCRSLLTDSEDSSGAFEAAAKLEKPRSALLRVAIAPKGRSTIARKKA